LPSTNSKLQLRLRVFAGPNGSGKSTVIEYVRNYMVGGYPVDFGLYINADEIASNLKTGPFSFNPWEFKTNVNEFCEIVFDSGLINATFTKEEFLSSFIFEENGLTLNDPESNERLAQIIADFLRKKLLQLKKRFSFETVFSHPSKLEIMRQARDEGYKVYLYFVSTESPEINKFRVLARVAQKGHNVPVDKIETRYYRSMDLLFEACQIAYQVFFFDNSRDFTEEQEIGAESLLFAHFKSLRGNKDWDEMDSEKVPEWFIQYYSNKVK
jgi:predicted ABC-type ATPase